MYFLIFKTVDSSYSRHTVVSMHQVSMRSPERHAYFTDNKILVPSEKDPRIGYQRIFRKHKRNNRNNTLLSVSWLTISPYISKVVERESYF